MKKLPVIVVCISFVMYATGNSMANTYTFNTQTDYNRLLTTGANGAAGYSSSGGISDSGSVLVTNSVNNNLPKYFTDSDRISTSAPIELSLYFQWTTPTQPLTVGYGVLFGIGTNANGETLTPYVSHINDTTSGTNREEIYIGIRTNGKDSNQVNLVSGNVSGLTNTTSYSTTTYGTLTSGDWYFMNANISPLSNGTGFEMNLGVFEANASTGAIGDEVFGGSVFSNNTALLNGTVNSFFAVRAAPWSGVTHIDNVTFASTIPEPSVVLLIICSATLLLFQRKRAGNR